MNIPMQIEHNPGESIEIRVCELDLIAERRLHHHGFSEMQLHHGRAHPQILKLLPDVCGVQRNIALAGLDFEYFRLSHERTNRPENDPRDKVSIFARVFNELSVDPQTWIQKNQTQVIHRTNRCKFIFQTQSRPGVASSPCWSRPDRNHHETRTLDSQQHQPVCRHPKLFHIHRNQIQSCLS